MKTEDKIGKAIFTALGFMLGRCAGLLLAAWILQYLVNSTSVMPVPEIFYGDAVRMVGCVAVVASVWRSV